MPIKAIVDSLEEVPEMFRDSYEEREGKFHLTGFVPREQVEDTSGLKSALKKERERAGEAERQLKAFHEAGIDLDTAKKLLNDQRQAEEQRALAAGEWDKVRGQMVDAHKQDLAKKDAVITGMRGTLESHLVDGEAARALAEAKGNVELLMPHVKRQVRVVEENGVYQVRVVDNAGNPRVNANGQYLTIKDLIGEMRGQETYQAAFKAEPVSGGGTQPNPGSAPGAQPTAGGSGRPAGASWLGKSRSQMTHIERAQAMKQLGKDDYLKLPA